MQLNLFSLENEVFGIEVKPVQEIVKISKIVKVPLSPPSLLGLTNLRGKIIPVISLKKLLSVEENEKEKHALILDIGQSVAILVDQVLSFVTVDDDQIEAVKNGDFLVDNKFINGIAKNIAQYDCVPILDIKSILDEKLKIEKIFKKHSLLSLSNTQKTNQQMLSVEDEKQVVCFNLGGQEYAIPIEYVQEIVKWPDKIIKVPDSESYFIGIMNLRDHFVPLISLNCLFGLRKTEDNGRIIVINRNKRKIGIAVDKVNEVLRVGDSYFNEVPLKEVEFVSNILNIQGRLISVISIDEILKISAKEVEEKMLEDRADKKVQESTEEEEDYMLIFKLKDEEYSIPINSVQEIVRLPEDITNVPNAPEGVKGIINLRCTVLPIIDLRQKLGMESVEQNDRQRIIVFLMNGFKVGFIVDSVSEVMRVPHKYIEVAPVDTSGIVNHVLNLTDQGRILQIINLEKLISKEEIEEFLRPQEELNEKDISCG